jgi:hypothetical protein
MSDGRIMIRGWVPSEEVRKCAEEAALEVVPEKFLAMRLTIDGQSDPEPQTNRRGEQPKARHADESPLLDVVLYRRLYNLVAGN